MLDKRKTREIARQLSITVPREIPIPDRNHFESYNHLAFPLLAKMADKNQQFGNTGLDLISNVTHIPDAATLREHADSDPEFFDNNVLQAYLPGNDVMLAVLMHDRNLIAAFQIRSLRTHPFTGGVTTFARTEPVNEELRESAVRLLRALEWEGIAQIDFRHDTSSGRFVLLEVNGRFWGCTAAAVQAGMDFPYWVWQCMHEAQPVVPQTYRTDLYSRWTAADLKRLLLYWKNPAMGWGSKLRETGLTLLAFRPGVREMIWDWADPRPAWRELREDLRYSIQNQYHKLRRRLHSPSPDGPAR